MPESKIQEALTVVGIVIGTLYAMHYVDKTVGAIMDKKNGLTNNFKLIKGKP